MTEPTTMNRLIHGAVRRDLDRLATALDEFRAGDTARAAELQRAFANLRRELTHHHEGEDTYVWPFLAGLGADAGLLAAMESEHAAMSAALAGTGHALGALARTGSAEDATAARASLARARAVICAHLDHEEATLEPLLLDQERTPEWKAVTKKLRHSSPGDAGSFFAWLTDGMNSADRASLGRSVPPPVSVVLTRVFGRRYAREVAPVWKSS